LIKHYKKETVLKIGILLFIIMIYVFVLPVRMKVNEVVSLLSHLDVDEVKEYILSFGIWAPIISFLLMMFQSVAAPLPAFIITFANAALFGWVKGAILSWSSAMVGAGLCYFIAKLYGREVVVKFTSKVALDNIDNFFEKYGKYAILIARLLPFMSFDIISYAAGLTSMTLWTFLVATGVGQLPATLIYSYVGDMLVGDAKKIVMGLLILFSLSILVVLLKKIWYEKNNIKEQN
jgi:uncharacterized membrane protein YdjX (TVP38/TMEM64 family)